MFSVSNLQGDEMLKGILIQYDNTRWTQIFMLNPPFQVTKQQLCNSSTVKKMIMYIYMKPDKYVFIFNHLALVCCFVT